MAANQNDASKIMRFDRNAKTEEFKRPDHPDFMTSSELAAKKFSGVRYNELGQQNEFWIVGEMVKAITFAEIKADPAIMGKTHVELFGLPPPEDKFGIVRSR